MTWLYVGLPAAMIASPMLFMGLWCHWTGVREGFLRLAVVTLATLSAFAGSAWLFWPEGTHTQLHLMFWSMGAFLLVLWGFGVPMIRNAVRALPEVDPAASLRPRSVELFPGAFVWPYLVWAGLVAWMLLSMEFRWVHLLGPALGLLSLLLLPPMLRLAAQEPEPLGGDNAASLAAAYAKFRDRRVRTMYWIFVFLALGVSGAWHVLPLHPAWSGSLFGVVIGCWGSLFGTWADAQRYLLRRQLSGAAPLK